MFLFVLADKVFEKIAEDFMKSAKMQASGVFIFLCISVDSQLCGTWNS